MNNVYISVTELSSYIQERYFKNKDLITIEDLIWEFEDLYSDYQHLIEEFEDFKRDVEDNYKPITQREAIGYDENW